jgi:hypothetical protein
VDSSYIFQDVSNFLYQSIFSSNHISSNTETYNIQLNGRELVHLHVFISYSVKAFSTHLQMHIIQVSPKKRLLTLFYYYYYYYYYYYLNTIGLTPGGSSTVHIYTQTVHRIQRKEHT